MGIQLSYCQSYSYEYDKNYNKEDSLGLYFKLRAISVIEFVFRFIILIVSFSFQNTVIYSIEDTGGRLKYRGIALKSCFSARKRK